MFSSHQLASFVALFGKEVCWFAGKYFISFWREEPDIKIIETYFVMQ